MEIHGLFNYWIFVLLLAIGLFAIVSRMNLIKKTIGLSVFQTSAFLMYITAGKFEGGTAPILVPGMERLFSNPLPQVLILTAIVVGISTTALALSIVVRINEEYGSVEEDQIRRKDAEEKGGA